MRFARFKDSSRGARRRLVAIAIVAAFASASAIGGVANAATGSSVGSTTQCQGSWTEAMCLIVAGLLKESNKPDFTPKDLQLAAPGGVIASTSTSARDVNRWRPNPQSWIDAKGRVASSSGLSTADLDRTGRWAPKLLKGAGVLGWLGVGADVTYALRDDYLLPSLGMQGQTEDSFCVREGNFATDLLGGLAGADCAAWRLDKDFEAVVGADIFTMAKPLRDLTYARLAEGGGAYCYSTSQSREGSWLGLAANERLQYFGAPPNMFFGTPYVGKNTLACGTGFFAMTGSVAHGPGLQIIDLVTNEVVDSSPAVMSQEAAEWLTEVSCSDGTKRWSVSESWQQEKFGAIAEPAAVQLEGCIPVDVRIGSQPVGTGVTPSNPWNPSPGTGGKGGDVGTTTAVPKQEVPDVVREWLTDFRQCWDGSCRLTLKKTITGTGEIDCFDSPAECLDWYEQVKTQPSTYKCYYAGQLRPISDCYVYKRVFDRQNVQTGTGYSDPKTGADPKTDTTTGTITKSNPGAQTVAMDTPATDPATKRECWPSGWGVFNPFEWVFQPVKCALEWAFVPRQAKITQVQTRIQLAATNSKPGELVDLATSWRGYAQSVNPDGCSGPTVSLNLMGITYSGTPLSACGEPASTLAFWSRIIIGISAVLAALFAVSRYAGRQFGFEGFGRSSGGDA